MTFLIAVSIIALASSIITIRTLVSYTDIQTIYKVIIGLVVLYAWFAPSINSFMRRSDGVPSEIYSAIYNFGYYMFGLAVILIVLLLARDFSWFTAYGLKLKVPSPTDAVALYKANIYTVLLAFAISFYGLYEGLKSPDVKELVIKSEKIKQETTVAMLVDMHITRGTSVATIKDIVAKTNALNPDAVVLVGDIVDDKPSLIEPQLNELKNLKAKSGIYVTLGNHEVYRGFMESIAVFSDLGFKFLMNSGSKLGDGGVFLGGIPDFGTSDYSPIFKINLKNTFQGSSDSDYKVVLSHNPKFISTLKNNEIDLQLSGHTHGGQIFPFQFVAKKQNNGYLAGLYDVGDMKAYVSRGTRFWGPPMRVLAPSEITLIKLEPK